MARYRVKDQVDLDWNKVRRRLTRELDTQIADKREEVLNVLLAEAWTLFAAALEKGETLELESGYPEFVAKALDDVIDVKPEIPTR